MTPLSWGLLLVLVVILASILGAVETRSRLLFVGGIALFILAHLVDAGPETAGTAIAVVGIAVAASATFPLLRRPA